LNRKVLVTAVLAVIAIAIAWLYSLGPLAGQKRAAKPNPRSLKPSAVPTAGSALQEYHNRDSKENYFGVTVPQAWQVASGAAPGSYKFAFDSVNASVELMDVPDNTTLELFVLSREEPRLKKATPGYERRSYAKTTVGGNEAHDLKYAGTDNAVRYLNGRVYVAGQDMSGVISVNAPESESLALDQALKTITTGFKWENP
jgi:hypothetical protein